MYISPLPTTAIWPTTRARALQFIGAAAVLWAVIAALLAMAGIDTFPRMLVFTECVGLTMVVGMVLLRPLRFFQRLASAPRWLLLCAIAVPAGYLVGHQLAFVLLGESVRLTGFHDISLGPLLFSLLAGGLGLSWFATREQLAREATARAEAQRLAIETQLRLLRTQLEPHMLFNTLANLRGLVREDADRAEAMIDRLITYLRATLAASQVEAVPLAQEFAQLRAYLEIMSLRMGPRLQWHLDLPAGLEGTAVPPMLLQPLVENAIKHGLEPKVGPGRVEVFARAVHAGIEFVVEDDGLGLPADACADPESEGYGVGHVRQRLHALHGAGAHFELQRREPCGVRAVLLLPR